MKNKKMTVSIGTSAYNEEQNIKKMLESVCSQKEASYIIKEIIVISDGSTDKTIEKVQTVKDKRIRLINDGKRMGKPTRLNMIFKLFKGDILVVLDSDMYINDKMTIENLISGFRKDKKISLIGGNVFPLREETFLEAAINNYLYARLDIKRLFDFGNTAYGARAFLAYSKKFAKSLTIPENVLNDDAFSYFACLKNGYKFYFERNATIFFRSPQTIKDHLRQSTRHLQGGIQLYKYFGENNVKKGFFVPKKILILLMIKQLLKNPFGYIFLRVLNYYCIYNAKSKHEQLDVKWKSINSSKKLSI